jgi:PIN domain nuclease of toxin-antitoxin system
MIVLDTHIWLWWINGNNDKLKPSWSQAMERSPHVGVAAISMFEVCWLSGHGRIALAQDPQSWIEQALLPSGIELCPLTPEIASLAVSLKEHHTDPQDRLIIATALSLDASLISADRKFKAYSELHGKLMA